MKIEKGQTIKKSGLGYTSLYKVVRVSPKFAWAEVTPGNELKFEREAANPANIYPCGGYNSNIVYSVLS